MASGGDKGKDKKGGKKKGKDLTESLESDEQPTSTVIDSTLAPLRANLPPEEEDQSNGEQKQARDLGAIPKAPKIYVPEEGKSKRLTRGTIPKPLKVDLPKDETKRRNRGQSLEPTPTIRTSRSWAQPSTSKSESHDEQLRTSPPMTRSQSKSPGRKLMGFAMSLRPKSISPLKRFHGMKPWDRDQRRSSETDPLLDHPDGIEREVPKKKKKVKYVSPYGIQFSQEDMIMTARSVSDEDEKSQTSTLSSQSSSGVAKATGKLNMDDSSECDEMEDELETERKGSSDSASTRKGKLRKPLEASKKKDRPSEESKKKDKSKKK